MRPRDGTLGVAGLALVVSFLLTGCLPISVLGTRGLRGQEEAIGTITPFPSAVPVALNTDEERLLVEVYQRVSPSVVSVQMVRRAALEGNEDLPSEADIYEGGQGSGFVVDGEAGYIVTNNHVVEGAESVEVVLSDGTTLPAQVIGTDPDSDIAVVQVRLEGRTLPAVTLGNSDTLQVGQRALAIGNPFGWRGTLTTGIVSGLGRTLPLGRTSERIAGQFSIPEMIQTDASINFGNSGGPLLDSGGRVIGMNTAMTSPTGMSAGVGFAIPVNTIKRVVPDLIARGYHPYAWMGVSGMDLLPVHVEAMALPVDRGAIVISVVARSPADAAGLRPSLEVVESFGEEIPSGGDVIVAIDGQPIAQFDDLLIYLVREKQPGDRVTLTIVREGEYLDVTLTLQERPAD